MTNKTSPFVYPFWGSIIIANIWIAASLLYNGPSTFFHNMMRVESVIFVIVAAISFVALWRGGGDA